MSQVQALEGQMKDKKLLIDRRNMAMRLASNRDFKKLIMDEFCLHEAARYVQLSADPAIPEANRADALNIAQASGHLKRFLSVTVQMGAHAEHTMRDLEEEIELARAEEDAPDTDDGDEDEYNPEQVDDDSAPELDFTGSYTL